MCNELYKEMTEKVYRHTVTIDSNVYRVQNISGRSDVLELGIDKGTDLHGFTANFIVTIEAIN